MKDLVHAHEFGLIRVENCDWFAFTAGNSDADNKGRVVLAPKHQWLICVLFISVDFLYQS